MWDVRHLEFREQPGPHPEGFGAGRVTSDRAGEIELINMLEESYFESVEDGAYGTQAIVCASCGCQHCAFGGWVQAKRLGEALAWLPVWLRYPVEVGEENDLAPPYYLSPVLNPEEPGCESLLFSPEAWEGLRKHYHVWKPAAEPPVSGYFPPLDSADIARLVQTAAPWLLGRPGEPVRLRRELAIAISDGELSGRLDTAERCLDEWLSNPVPVERIGDPTAASEIEFATDLDGMREWRGLQVIDGEPCLALSPEHVFRRVSP